MCCRLRSLSRRHLAAGLAALPLLVAADPAWANLYTVGVGGGCSHATVQAAVDAAALTAEADTILVARNTTYSGQAISIENQSLTVIGGVPTCTNFLPDGRTTLSGSGGAAAPVISIRGSGNVSISRINLTGGDTGLLGEGGGLYFRGSGVVRLDDMNVTNNQAGEGGGIYARGTSDTAELNIGANVLISNNTALLSGGGIAAEDVRLMMTSPDSAVFLNTAVGTTLSTGFIGGDGGGIYCDDCQADIATGTALGAIFLNTAYGRGGGIAVIASGRDSMALLYTKTATKPLTLYGNQAGLRGGAVYVQSNFESIPPDFHHSQVYAWDIIIRQNTAPEGAAVFLKGHEDFNGWADSQFVMGNGHRGVACGAASGPCNRITGNVSQDLEGVATNGAIIEDDANRDTPFTLFHTIIDDNVGRSVLDKSASHSRTELKRCLLTRNTVSEDLIQHRGDSSFLVLDQSTIAGNDIGGSHVILIDRAARIGHSIVWQPGKKVLRRQNSGGNLTLANLLVNDIDGLPPQVDILGTTDAGFMSATSGDYHLRPDSVAVDFAQYAFDPSLDIAYDLDWGPVEVDLPEVLNEFGPRDLGAYEMPEIPDLIFRDGFETGGLTAWAGAATDGGDLSAAQVSAMDGTWGLRGVVDDTAGLYVQDDAPWSEPRYRARFHFDTNGFDPGETAGKRRTRLFIGFAEAPQRRVFALVLRRLGGQYSVMARARLDDDRQADTPFHPIADGPHSLEIDWGRSTGPDAENGWMQVWIDGALVAQSWGLDNHLGVVDFVRLGALSVKQTATGTLHWDAFESRRETYIGPVP